VPIIEINPQWLPAVLIGLLLLGFVAGAWLNGAQE
jgi:hypothetical protein